MVAAEQRFKRLIRLFNAHQLVFGNRAIEQQSCRVEDFTWVDALEYGKGPFVIVMPH